MIRMGLAYICIMFLIESGVCFDPPPPLITQPSALRNPAGCNIMLLD